MEEKGRKVTPNTKADEKFPAAPGTAGGIDHIAELSPEKGGREKP